MREVLLQLLQETPRHGYQLKVEFEARTGGVWPLNVGQVYTTLERLARDGCVAELPAGDGPHRTFEITEEGRREVKDWLRASPLDTTPARDDLIMKVLVAVGRGDRDALDVIADQRSALMGALQLGRREQRSTDGEDVQRRLARDAVLTRMEADVQWLDRCEEQLRAALPKPRRTR